MTPLKAPFPYFGGKRVIAAEVWRRFGDTPNYIEPFLGSAAVLLARPAFEGNRIETVNDADGHVANFWRALQADPDAVAYYADWPVSECVPAGTMIATPSGEIPVEAIREGMTVWGVSDGALIPAIVSATRQSKAIELYQLGPLQLTGNHPVWTKEQGYTEAASLTEGMTIARLNWPFCELDFAMVQSGHDRETMDCVRSKRPAYRRSALRRRFRSSKGQIQRTSFARRQGGQYPSGLLDTVIVDARDTTRLLRLRSGNGRYVAGTGEILDSQVSCGGTPNQYHRGRRRIARIHPHAGATPEVVADEERRQVRAGAAFGDARQDSHARDAQEDSRRRATSLQARNATQNSGEVKGARYVRVNRKVGRSTSGCSVIAGTSGQNCGQDNGPQVGFVRRNWRGLPVNHSRGASSWGERSISQSGDSQGFPLQRESLSAPVAVYNFQTSTGNYFANRILVHNCDLHARGDWLYYRPSAREWVEQLRADPEFYDAKSAGWWVWFVSSWIGGLPSIHGRNRAGTPETGIYDVLPHAGNAGMGVHRPAVGGQRPHLGSGGQGNGVHGLNEVSRQIPELRSGRSGVRSARATGPIHGQRRAFLTDYLRQLAARLERVRVCCGDWSRVTGPSVTFKHGVTAVFLDPPYSAEAGRHATLYSTEDDSVAHAAREWAIANGDNPLMRIALCGYDTEHGEAMPDAWHAWRWKASGGYGSQGNGRGRANAGRETVWFSPHCINPIETLPLFRGKEAQPTD